MRFCNNCGNPLTPAPAAAPAPAPQAPPSTAYPRSAPVCWRCRSAGDAGAEFCKFCGARYADAPPAQPAAPAAGVQPSVGAAVAAYAFGNGAPPPAAPAAPPRNERTNLEQGAVAASTGTPLGVLVAILKDGSDGRAHTLFDEQTDIGRTEGQIALGDDPYLSPRHARLHVKRDGITIRDLDSLNGVYVRLREQVDLNDGDHVLLGQQVMRFEVLPEPESPLGPAMLRGVLVFGTPEVPRVARLVQYTTEGVARDVHYLYRDETVVGREQGDIVCTDDPFMSRRHASITFDRTSRRFTLRDLGSSNGTAIRIRGERTLKPGDQFRVGRHLFRYDRASDSPGHRPGPGDRAGA
jgi:pSer/pThr/pTyr-binding forkhead associated (FHA) protein